MASLALPAQPRHMLMEDIFICFLLDYECRWLEAPEGRDSHFSEAFFCFHEGLGKINKHSTWTTIFVMMIRYLTNLLFDVNILNETRNEILFMTSSLD